MEPQSTFGLPGIAAGFMPTLPGAVLQAPSGPRLRFDWLEDAQPVLAEETREPSQKPAGPGSAPFPSSSSCGSPPGGSGPT